ncbi:hypothetical protein QYE76_055830 [Lolium multiflorum]|uniref:Bifunctional inhibitor/plant lipid transfer protein/seed storage helical domain-containing protein n=1 Tax=Lolium multiflorum TaxID=4521 RepID=A0AAD8T1S9_LOLMU|nr:hypothetical protein QYE76_055830 [Lolium multiflorum]
MAMLRLKWAAALALLAVAVGTASAAHSSAHAPVAAAPHHSAPAPPVAAAPPAHHSAPAPPMAATPATAPAPGATLSPECMDAVLNMSDCLPYVSSGSTDKHPDKACCPELDGLLQSNPVCLCELLAGGGDSYGVSVDYKRAMALPGVCRLNAPPLSACAAFGVPVGPSASPLTGVSPSATGPQMPENPPSVSPSKSAASGHFTASGLAALAALPLAITAAAMF